MSVSEHFQNWYASTLINFNGPFLERHHILKYLYAKLDENARSMNGFPLLDVTKTWSFMEICFKLKGKLKFKNCDFLQRNVWRAGSVYPAVIHFLVKIINFTFLYFL